MGCKVTPASNTSGHYSESLLKRARGKLTQGFCHRTGQSGLENLREAARSQFSSNCLVRDIRHSLGIGVCLRESGYLER